MNAREAYFRLHRLGVPVVRTRDAASVLGQSSYAAHKTLSRLAEAGLIQTIHHGLYWVAALPVNMQRLAEQLASPYPAYVSLLTALYLHGMISQIPATIYAVTLGRTRRVHTSVGQFSFHHVTPELFDGYDDREGVKLATPEKALFDIAYLGAGRSRFFKALPELELSARFRAAKACAWLRYIGPPRLRQVTSNRLEKFITAAR